MGAGIRYKESIDESLSEPYDFYKVKPCIESKVFGIGVEACTVGSAEFALSCAAMNRDRCIPLMDNGHSRRCGKPLDGEWFPKIQAYEKKILEERT